MEEHCEGQLKIHETEQNFRSYAKVTDIANVKYEKVVKNRATS